ncbi:MAG TPA: BlaI/MecI/CopY family transcriptional regulator [Candidatus Mediterraneibacter ornithocaccae]|jgi:predicted transcriptional regulator|uniref:BlaI/MecI/CopY family transcriptional regulator n=1 Tax=Mediterraneibacter glycyrrhizinilyticus TaxID=342942 RepID=UPI001F8547DA|nr:BlaI/MecI/CopY family transcriptional regulator [Mediterraneibacter glycyrrhizinilyticus]MDN0062666.1 BlaI/MecI/CopY family transcriptional regulator [Mediterraneibacter glycyrrhizinilyticus]HJA19782.1 BlaI/MecI/CopY family transcriptional regulator [Candidatus Mediterraneibacter ornithocaccae]
MKNMKRLPESELEIMQIIWKEETPVSRITIEHSLQEKHPLAPTTILTLLTRLCEKGFLSLKKDGRSNLYEPLITEREYLACESRSFLDRMFGGSIAGFATALCDSGIKKEELEELKRMLEKGEL